MFYRLTKILLILSVTTIIGCNNVNSIEEITKAPIITEQTVQISTHSDNSKLKPNFVCDCESNEDDILDCDTTLLSNNALLYWKINCDSAVYCFENNNKIRYLKSGSDYFLINRIGLTYIEEYNDYLFFKDELISGCCTPPDLVFLNKIDASEINRIPSSHFVFGNPEKDYITYFQDDSLTEFIFHDLNTNRKNMTVLENNIVLRAIDNNSIIHVNDLVNINDDGNEIILELEITPKVYKEFKIKSW